ncbi:MAG: 23S rRNA (pseudouridine(1915)-N(3))-methyltransferase RlmH [Rickettsiales bacterium]|nr:23S rRNA (pseudouridine(1915)-N(3))-methyltransferase RlmH [Rickettsiales bacterium]|tara:strand:- start:1086 stop:1541 length:456 start_codon:yes stop_codon:yes gene_type:complete
MQITLAAVGKMRQCPEQDLLNKYISMLPWAITIKEIDSKKTDIVQRKADEADKLLAATADAHIRIALDEHGKTWKSREFASHFQQWQDEGIRHVAFLIGGQDGLDKRALEAARLSIAFGKLTWPHMLMRPLLAEQLYRSYSILTNHPYHRD